MCEKAPLVEQLDSHFFLPENPLKGTGAFINKLLTALLRLKALYCIYGFIDIKTTSRLKVFFELTLFHLSVEWR